MFRKSLTNKSPNKRPRASQRKISDSKKSPVDNVMLLQKTFGNQIVQRLINSGHIMAKLVIGKQNDPYEREADQVADRVMQTPDQDVQGQTEVGEEEEVLQSKSISSGISSVGQKQEVPEDEEIQKQTESEEEEQIQSQSAEEEEGQIQAQNAEEEEDNIQPKENKGGGLQESSYFSERLQSLRGGGKPLQESVRASFENRFGHDFGDVHTHSGGEASDLARSINAKAFTSGKDIVFGAGQYSTQTSQGKRLLAHELTHVVQQNANSLQNSPIIPAADYEEKQTRVKQKTARSLAVVQASPRRQSASKIIPDLDAVTVQEMRSSIRYGISSKIRQELIDFVVQDRQRKGVNFGIMEKGKPIYVEVYPEWVPKKRRQSNGITLPPGQVRGCTGSKPCVFIGPSAFGGESVEQRMIRLYSAIMHEYQHAKQWQEPTKARALGTAGREVEAFFWEIENSKRTGLFEQRGSFKNVWNEAKEHWLKFKMSNEWDKLRDDERQRYIIWHKRVSKIAKEALSIK